MRRYAWEGYAPVESVLHRSFGPLRTWAFRMTLLLLRTRFVKLGSLRLRWQTSA